MHWISGQALEWFCGDCKKHLLICDEHCEFKIAGLLITTSFLKVKENKANIMKGNKPIVNSALLGPRHMILKVLGQTCAAFYSTCFVFYKQLKAGNRSNRVVLKSTSEKHIEHVLYAFQQIRSWSSNYLVDYKKVNFLDMNSWVF